MLNSNDFISLIKSTNKNKEYFQSLLSKNQIYFRNISNFPEEKGLYFIFYQNKLLYIGSAYTNGRTIKKRCQQYLQKGRGGESFRGKIEILKKIPTEDAIKFIQENISAKFICYNNFEKDKIMQLEQIAIYSCQPPLNFILQSFNYKNIETKEDNAKK